MMIIMKMVTKTSEKMNTKEGARSQMRHIFQKMLVTAMRKQTQNQRERNEGNRRKRYDSNFSRLVQILIDLEQ